MRGAESYCTISLTFRAGTAIYIFVSANCSYSVELDDSPVNVPSNLPGSGLLYYQTGLSFAIHTIQVTANPDSSSGQQLALGEAVFTNTIDQE